MEIRLEGTLWIINDGEYIIGEGESTAYVVSDYDGETVYSNDDFECCLTWVWNSIQNNDFMQESEETNMTKKNKEK